MNSDNFQQTLGEELYGQADFRLLMPYLPGQRALIIGDSWELAQSLENAGVEPVIARLGRGNILESPLGRRIADHAFILESGITQLNLILDYVTNILKPGGWLLICVRNSENPDLLLKSIKRLVMRQPRRISQSYLRPLAISQKRIVRSLEQRSFDSPHIFGIESDIRYPGLMIPLDQKDIIRNFYKEMFSPFSWKDRVMQQIARVLITLRLQRVLFSHLGLVAQFLADGGHTQ